MKRWLSLCAVAISVQACMAMDGEHERMRKGPAKATPDTARGGEPPVLTDAGAQSLQSADAGVANTAAVECGTSTCSGSKPSCCASIDTGTCVDAATTACPGDRFLMRCDEPSDCGADGVCCAWWDNTQPSIVWESACTARSACEPASSADGQQAVVLMCMADADCPAGSTCSVEATNAAGTGLAIKAGFCSF